MANLLEESTGAEHHWLFKLQLFSQLLMMKIMMVIIVMIIIIIILGCNYWNRMGDNVFTSFHLWNYVFEEKDWVCVLAKSNLKREEYFFARWLSMSKFNLDEIKHEALKKEESPLLTIISKQPLLIIDKWQRLRANIVLKYMVKWKWNLPNETKLSSPYHHPTRPTTLPWEIFPDVTLERNSALT